MSKSVSGKVLVADDESNIRDVLINLLTAEGFSVDAACDGLEAIKRLDQNNYDIVISDLKMPGCDGLDVLRHLANVQPDALGIIATGFGSIESAIEALRLGAFDYVTKPFHIDEMRQLVCKAREYQQLRDAPAESASSQSALKPAAPKSRIVGRSPIMSRLADLIATVADSDSTILILGESGTGKELVARSIHQQSARARKPLIPVNCGAIPEDLLESELFGHVKGAFTGATMDRIGRFQLADGGTIFLDEIGDMSPKLQVKLLRVLQEREFEPVGGTKTFRCDARVLAATNHDLEKRVAEGKFREDLYYRLNVIPLHIPPLRDRIEDLPELAEHFVKYFNKCKNRKIEGFSDEAMQAMTQYAWPGNVRELENLVERMAILYREGMVEISYLPERIGGERPPAPKPHADSLLPAEIPEEGLDYNELVGQFETRLIEMALARTGGVKNRAATMLGIKRTTLVEKLKKKGMLV